MQDTVVLQITGLPNDIVNQPGNLSDSQPHNQPTMHIQCQSGIVGGGPDGRVRRLSLAAKAAGMEGDRLQQDRGELNEGLGQA